MSTKGNGKNKALSDPTQLAPVNKKDGALQVVIETPKGSRNKYAFDPEQGIFLLRKVLPTGMVFPYDFGFLPRTKGDDGDPIDVLVLMDEPVFPGCLLRVRLIGVIEGEQQEGKKKFRNDRLLAVAESNYTYAKVHSPEDLPDQFLRELEDFFVNYNKLQGRQYRLLGCKGEKEAQKLIREAQKAAA